MGQQTAQERGGQVSGSADQPEKQAGKQSGQQGQLYRQREQGVESTAENYSPNWQ
jgi:hypothetical protein